jgi:hypothetical protein
MNIKDLDKILQEYLKHYGKEEFGKYFKEMIKINNNKGEKNATSKEKSNNSSRSN